MRRNDDGTVLPEGVSQLEFAPTFNVVPLLTFATTPCDSAVDDFVTPGETATDVEAFWRLVDRIMQQTLDYGDVTRADCKAAVEAKLKSESVQRFLRQYRGAGITPQSAAAIIWYTDQRQAPHMSFYQLVNGAVRATPTEVDEYQRALEQLRVCGPIVYHLLDGLANSKFNVEELVLYRGVAVDVPPTNAQGAPVFWRSPTSMSHDIEVARRIGFASSRESTNLPRIKATILGVLCQKASIASIGVLSLWPNEFECLMHPNTAITPTERPPGVPSSTSDDVAWYTMVDDPALLECFNASTFVRGCTNPLPESPALEPALFSLASAVSASRLIQGRDLRKSSPSVSARAEGRARNGRRILLGTHVRRRDKRERLQSHVGMRTRAKIPHRAASPGCKRKCEGRRPVPEDSGVFAGRRAVAFQGLCTRRPVVGRENPPRWHARSAHLHHRKLRPDAAAG
jgi:hypothetical protein